MRRSLVAVAVAVAAALALVACSKDERLAPPKADPGKASQGATLTAGPAVTAAKPEAETCGKSKVVKSYGAKLAGTDIVDVEKVLASPDQFADKRILVQGQVRAACSKKGCWMELAKSMDKDAAGTRVTFQDYGFFVPTTSAGKTACVEGLVSTRRVAPEEVAHMEAEGARFAKKAAVPTRN